MGVVVAVDAVCVCRFGLLNGQFYSVFQRNVFAQLRNVCALRATRWN
jgi:hypothetical protein